VNASEPVSEPSAREPDVAHEAGGSGVKPAGEEPAPPPRVPTPAVARWRLWAFLAVPVLGVIEVGAHVREVTSVVPNGDWALARDYVAAQVKPDDLILFAPRWTDPIGRMVFGDGLASMAREARADDTRFARAFEVSIRGGHAGELAGWRRVAAKKLGRVTVTTWENPSPLVVKEDLLSLVDPAHLTVSRGSDACPFARRGAESGSTGFGPAVPANRFACPGGSFVGISVFPDLDYNPHRAIFAPPGSGPPLRMRFQGVHFGRALRGHHGLYVEAEREERGAPVTLKLTVDDKVLGTYVHHDGEGWKSFELATPELEGQQGDLVVEVSTPRADRRTYLFEASTL